MRPDLNCPSALLMTAPGFGDKDPSAFEGLKTGLGFRGKGSSRVVSSFVRVVSGRFFFFLAGVAWVVGQCSRALGLTRSCLAAVFVGAGLRAC